MPFDGSGNYSLPGAPDFPAVSGAVISSTYFNNVMEDIQAALTNVICKDGQVMNADPITLGDLTTTNLLKTKASALGGAGLRIPHGTAPSAPVNGDVWTTTNGVFSRINGTTQRLLASPVALSTVATTAGTTATFSGLNLTYSKLIFTFAGVGHATGTTNLQMQVSGDGTTWSTASTILASVTNTTYVNGSSELWFYATNQATMRAELIATVTAALVSPASAAISGPVTLILAVTGGIDYARFAWANGSAFNNGAITAWGV